MPAIRQSVTIPRAEPLPRVEKMPPRRTDGPTREYLSDGTDVTTQSDRALLICAVNSTLANEHQIGQLAAEVGRINGAWLLISERLSKIEEMVRELRRSHRQSQHEIHHVEKRLTDSQAISLQRINDELAKQLAEAQRAKTYWIRRFIGALLTVAALVLAAVIGHAIGIHVE